MRTLLLLGWLLVPVVGAAYHYGPGQERMRLDDVGAGLAAADTSASGEDWETAATRYDAAMGGLPADRTGDVRRARLERDKAWMNSGRLPEANADLEGLVDEVQADPKADADLLKAARGALAHSQYYLTWLMKLEGLGRDDWEPEIESARQAYRLLGEQAERARDVAGVEQNRRDLESTIRLARMEPGELQGMKIPKPCQNCQGGACKCKGQGKGRKQSPSSGTPKDSRGAGSGPPPDGSGS